MHPTPSTLPPRPSGLSAAPSGLLLLLLLLLAPAESSGQLRPLDPLDWDPLDWDALDSDRSVSVSVGTAVFTDHSASLAGTRGRLVEVGRFRGTFLLGRTALQWSGSAVRIFHDCVSFADPVGQARGMTDSGRIDAGDQRLSTVVRLTEGTERWDAALRFGVRLPTTDNRIGLERDRTDFFATVAGRWVGTLARASAELGIGIWGTRDPVREQIDPILFALSGRLETGPVRPELEIVGQHDTRPRSELRGNEDLGEARLFARMGDARWLRLGVVRGWDAFSPDFGVIVEAGFRY